MNNHQDEFDPNFEMELVHEEASADVYKRWREIEGFLIRGNAGGVVATLGFIGTTYGNTSAVMWPQLAALFCFVVGCALYVVSRSLHLDLTVKNRKALVGLVVLDHDEVDQPMMSKLVTDTSQVLRVSGLFLLIGGSFIIATLTLMIRLQPTP